MNDIFFLLLLFVSSLSFSYAYWERWCRAQLLARFCFVVVVVVVFERAAFACVRARSDIEEVSSLFCDAKHNWKNFQFGGRVEARKENIIIRT